MSTTFHVLITSISKKIPLIKAVRNAAEQLKLKSLIVGSDSDSQCIGRYFVDDFWRMPKQEALTIEELIHQCKQRGVQAIIPTRDGELPFFAEYRDNLAKEGIACFVSPLQTVQTCDDKLRFCEFLKEHNYPVVETRQIAEEVHSESLIVKECFGAGSRSIGLNLDLSAAKAWGGKLKSPIYQPYIHGKEYSIDLYIDRTGKSKGSIARERELVVQGESQVTATLTHPDMERLCVEAAELLGIYGHAVFQVLLDRGGQSHILECNARFGGASTLSLAMGLKSFEWFFQEMLHYPLSPFLRSSQEMRQIRYPEDLIVVL